ncbi:permease prefix domain 1-containing protein [Aldersonia sp. NBC_00410]|uniref:permease prefix domain 1-containing protein n=1 Tax=Aldersonia sp. NBC_00410 TaxID=2975954 RepID=UPI00224DCF28|nr:permease prefix domain 1-containing protein [Aldersonia sp. NBC_00410]MCX5044163.1 permease prefix domain 1-containing protein [Aldersonia sp. NBC_00410]
MDTGFELESQIGQWRGYVERRGVIAAADAEEMEDHLREQISDLSAAGLEPDEAFLVAVKRMGNVDGIAREFAREHSDRLWKQLVLLPATPDGVGKRAPRELMLVLFLAVLGGVAIKIGLDVLDEEVFARNVGLFVLPFLAGYFAWKRRAGVRVGAALLVAFVLAAVLLNVYPFEEGGSTAVIVAIHAPLALWFVVGVAYVGGEWRSDRRRMDFIRFTGEWIVYLTLLGLGGGVLIGLTVGVFDTLGTSVEWFIEDWVVPFGAVGALLVAAWLVEAKQNVVENIAPVLTRVFTPLTTIMLLVLLAAFATSGSLVDVDRQLLILMDVILIVVLGLLLYAISARDPYLAPDLFDRLQFVLVISALAVDTLMLVAMLSRIAEFGFTPNKTAALGMNLVLLVNLTWSAVLLFGFVRGHRRFGATERWQTTYLPVFGIWAAVVVAVLPPLFDFA